MTVNIPEKVTKERYDRVRATGTKTRDDVGDVVAYINSAHKILEVLIEMKLDEPSARMVAKLALSLSGARIAAINALYRIENGK